MITTSYTPTEYTADGTTTTYLYVFPVVEAGQIKVYVTGVSGELELVDAADYTVNLTTGQVIFDTAPDFGLEIKFERDTVITQDVDYVQGQPFFSDSHEDQMDKMVMNAQEFDEKADNLDTRVTTLKTDLEELEIGDLANVDTSSASAGDGLILNSDGDWVPSVGFAPVSSVNSKVGAVVLDKTDIGLPDVDNTSDADKPVSTAQQDALDLKANSADLSAVATSNSYDELDDKPLISSYRLETGTTVTRQTSDVFVNHTAGTLTSIDLGDPSSVPSGFVFSVASNSFTDSLSVVDDVPNAVFFSNLPNRTTLGGRPVHSWMSTGSSWFQEVDPERSKIRRETGLTTTRQSDDGLVIFTGVGDVTEVDLGSPAPFDTDDREFSFAVRSLDASFSVVSNFTAITFDEAKIDRKLDIGAATYNVYTYVSEANSWRPFYGAGDGIVEEITNTNGTAVKFESGLMICSGIVSVNLSSSWATRGSVHNQPSAAVTFPESFVSAPSVTSQMVGTAVWSGINSITVDGFIPVTWSYTNTVSGDVSTHYQAIGRWK